MALISVTISGNAAPLKKSVEESEGLLGKLGGSFTKFGAIAAAGMGAAAAGIGLAAKAAAEDQKSFEQMAITLRNVTGATEEMTKAVDDQLGAMSLATGVADDKLRPAFEALVRGTKDTERAMQDMTLVLDISTALQMDQTTVADALAKAYQGNFKALRTLSPEMAQLITDGIDAEGALSVLADTFGGSAAAAADTFSGQVDRLKVFLSELVEQVGYYVLPVLSKIAEFIVNDVVPAFQRIVDRYGPALAAIFERIATFIGDKVVPVMRDKLIPFIQQVAEFIGTRLVPVIRDVALVVFDKLRAIFEVVSDRVQANSENIQKAVTFFRTLTDFVTQKVAPVLTTVLKVAFDVVAKAIGPVIDLVFDLMGAFASLGTFLLKVAGFMVKTFETAINGVIDVANFAIRTANKLNPFSDIPEIGNVSISSAFGKAPTAPGAPSGMGDSGPDAVERRLAGMTPDNAGFTIPALVPSTPTGGSSGGSSSGKTAAARTGLIDELSEDVMDQIAGLGGGAGGAGYGAAMGNEALLDGLTGGISAPTQVNIVVNTVSADANLPNLIVDALQQYNLISGPIDVAIAN